MIGIIYAMEEEFRNIINIMQVKLVDTISGINFKIGEIFGKECVLALSGIGKVHAAMCSQSMIIKYKPNLIINLGTAGAIDHKLNILDLVVAENVIQYDYDISAFKDKTKGQISGINISKIPCDSRVSKLFIDALKSINKRVYFGDVLTGDRFIDNKQELVILENEFKGLACEMECGAIGQVCYINNIRFAVMKVISDRADKSSKDDFEKYINESAKIMHDILRETITKI